MKKLLSLTLLAMVLATGMQGCSLLRSPSGVQVPEIEYQSFRISEVDHRGAVILFQFEVENPNRREISAEAYEYALYVEGGEIVSGSNVEGVVIPAGEKSMIEIPVAFTYRQLTAAVRSVARNDSISYELRTNLTFDLPVLGKREVPVVAEGQLPKISMPEIKYDGYELHSVSLAGADISVRFRLHNPNNFGFQMKSLKYSIQLLGDEVVKTSMDENLRIEAGASEEISFRIRLDSAQMSRSALQILMGNNSMEYQISAEGDFSADLPKLSGSVKVPLEQSGSFRISR